MVSSKQRLILFLYIITALVATTILIVSLSIILKDESISVKDHHVIAFSNSLIILVLLPVPKIIFRLLGYIMPTLWHYHFIVFIWLSLIIGEIVGIYRITTYYDSIIHVIGGYLIALFGLFILNSFQGIQSRLMLILFVFSFAQGVAVIWELFEFMVDYTFGSNMQSYFDDINQVYFIGQDALKDTILDLFLNIIGSIICLIIYPIYKTNLVFVKYTNIEKGPAQ